MKYAVAEKPVYLDTGKAPSMTDVMVYCESAGEPVIIGVEGKATEPFAERICDWVKGSAGIDTKPSRARRLKFLNDAVGLDVPATSTLRYQLLHRTASVLLESVLHGAATAVLVIHSFADEDPTNWKDFQAFATHLGINLSTKNVIGGPAKLGPNKDIRLFAAWVADSPHS